MIYEMFSRWGRKRRREPEIPVSEPEIPASEMNVETAELERSADEPASASTGPDGKRTTSKSSTIFTYSL